MKENFSHFFDKLKEVYARMELRQRVMIAILLAVTFAIIIWMISWSMRTEYGLLFSRLAAEDAQTTMTRLRELKIPYRLRDDGTSIYIPANRVPEIRIHLVTDSNIGQRHTGVGFEIFDRTTLGTTDFVQRNVNWKRANEGELERSILTIDGVEFVRVHLVFPEERLFRDDQREPSASVMLRLSRQLSVRSIEGIVNWIASAVEGLDPQRVKIIDHNGRELTTTQDDTMSGMVSQQFAIQRQLEESLTARAQSMLDDILTSGNSRVVVTVDMNFDLVETMSERFDPEGQVVRSEEIQTNNLTNLRDSLATVNEHIITNYEISTTVERRQSQPGDIRRLSVAAFVNYRRNRRIEDGKEIIEFVERSTAEMAQIEAAIRTAVGFNSLRGDQVAVSSMLFDRSAIDEFRTEQERQQRMKEYMAYAERGAVFIVLIVLVFVLTSQFKKIFAEPEPEVDPEAIEEELRPALEEGAADEGFYPEGDEGLPMGEGKISFTFKPMKDIEIEQTEAMLLQETIQKFVIENPEVTVKLIKSWLLDEKHPGKK
jgi:flagellar M-ring protein FliF